MAETDVSHECRGEPGFSCSVFWPWQFSYVTFTVCYMFLKILKTLFLNFKPLTEQNSAAKIKYFYLILSQD